MTSKRPSTIAIGHNTDHILSHLIRSMVRHMAMATMAMVTMDMER